MWQWTKPLPTRLSGAYTALSRETKSSCNTKGADWMADKEATSLVKIWLAIDHRAFLLGPRAIWRSRVSYELGQLPLCLRTESHFSSSTLQLRSAFCGCLPGFLVLLVNAGNQCALSSEHSTVFVHECHPLRLAGLLVLSDAPEVHGT